MRNGSPCKSCCRGMRICPFRSQMSKPNQAGSSHTRMMYIRYYQFHYCMCSYRSSESSGRFGKLKLCCLGSTLLDKLTNTYLEADTSRWPSASKTHNSQPVRRYTSNSSNHTAHTTTNYYSHNRNWGNPQHTPRSVLAWTYHLHSTSRYYYWLHY